MRKKKKAKLQYSEKKLRNEILRGARELEYAKDWGEVLADKVIDRVDQYLALHVIVDDDDIKKVVEERLSELDEDLALLLKHHNKLI
jgi:hemerythrin